MNGHCESMHFLCWNTYLFIYLTFILPGKLLEIKKSLLRAWPGQESSNKIIYTQRSEDEYERERKEREREKR